MKKAILFILLFYSLAVFADVLTVKKDGTGDYTQIQTAIDYSTNGDTVLVWPGTYYENINLNGRSITLGSLILTTGIENYKYSTIIDGNKNGSCILINSNEEQVVINGFTLQNGYTLDIGGGIVAKYPTIVQNCVIKNNFALRGGGGVACSWNNSLLTLKKCSIFNNYTYGAGGGVVVGYKGSIILDSILRNSIYLNYANRGCDFHKADETNVNSVIFLDTSTVLYPDTYFYSSINNEGYQKLDLSVKALNSFMEAVDNDLYVNPITGNDTNSGLSWESPLKTIAFANSKIYVDSTEKNTIHLANGVYSDTTNDEKFPINIRPFVNIIGQSRKGVILDGNQNVFIFKGNNSITDFSLQRMTLQGGPVPDYDDYLSGVDKNLAYIYTENHRFLLDSIIFQNSIAEFAIGILTFYQADSSIVQNCIFKDNIGGYAIRTASYTNGIHFINNCIFTNQQPDDSVPPDTPSMGQAFNSGNYGITVLQNCLFYNNPKYGTARWIYGDTYYINCTFANNSWMDNAGFLFTGDANSFLYNCIAYDLNDDPITIATVEWQKMYHSHLNIYNSLIEGGEESITMSSSCWHHDTVWCHVHYDSTNIDADPMFLGMWNDPYMISDGSPCIDAGTLANIPDFIELPEYDLAGNPRVVGDSIDMGAYEWNPTIVGFHDIGQDGDMNKNTLLKVSPNPFRENTLIEFFDSQSAKQGQTKTDFKIEVYDNYGRLVRNILSTTLLQDQKIPWQGDDNNGNLLPAGIYNVVLFSGDKEIESLKVVKQ